MLLELSINDFAIIERTTIRFAEGMNVLTGETGAGKSILLDALGAVLGARVSSDLVRTGADLARVEAAFGIDLESKERLQLPLAELGVDIDADDTIILSREIQANGRSSARINGRLATANTLNQIGVLLVDIHGQSEHLAILKSGEQRNLLDRFASLDEAKAQVAEGVREWRALRNRIDELARNSREREQRIDLLRFQVDEIDTAALTPGEDDSLASERDVLRNADRLRADALEGLAILVDDNGSNDSDITSRLRLVATRASDIASLDSAAGGLEERANEILVLAEDLARDLRAYAERVESDEQRLSEVEDRIATIQALRRKYGATIQDVLDFADDARATLSELSSGEFDLSMLQDRVTEASSALSGSAVSLSVARQGAAVRLAGAIERSIEDLAMGSARIEIEVRQREDTAGIDVGRDGDTQTVHIDETGIDDVQFMIAPNAGEALKPLNRIASGGETARLMLATKSILSDVDLTPTLVFDEIDVGVGGRSGQVVGEKLWGISRQHQVIVVTHLPQIAAFAGNHLRIEKLASGERVVSQVRQLDWAERELEIAAMIDGLPPGEAAKLNARTMLERSRTFIASVK